jgi:hypothetical protein
MVKSSIPENRENLISIMHSDEQHAKDQEERKPIDSEKNGAHSKPIHRK